MIVCLDWKAWSYVLLVRMPQCFWWVRVKFGEMALFDSLNRTWDANWTWAGNMNIRIRPSNPFLLCSLLFLCPFLQRAGWEVDGVTYGQLLLHARSGSLCALSSQESYRRLKKSFAKDAVMLSLSTLKEIKAEMTTEKWLSRENWRKMPSCQQS